MDLNTFLVDNILDYTDRMSMATALEVRVPLLDPGFVEMSLNIPFAYKVRNEQCKVDTRRCLQRILPARSPWLPKRGFNAPLGQWFNHLLDPYFDAAGRKSKSFAETIRRRRRCILA